MRGINVLLESVCESTIFDDQFSIVYFNIDLLVAPKAGRVNIHLVSVCELECVSIFVH